MTVENKAKEDTFNTNYSFLKKWHDENYTLLPKGSKNKDTSMQLGTIEFDGITYILPTYKKGYLKVKEVSNDYCVCEELGETDGKAHKIKYVNIYRNIYIYI